ncbi:hypothetical protein CYMTET_14276 [Cymbomonas tetramitiformis]|uniref:Uncharacterized protein n=1 Tax=Cymbomonas tetramitiformis TaxID=36881 RepID=A0AAE0GHU5_9CHLO|nr:hypothetical protein CYMTET_14276 [Cymbomonas tetramitiformis]
MVIISCVGFANGDPIVLLYGPDYDGNICNRNEDGADLKGYKNRYWMNPNEVIAAENDQMSLKDAASICLKSCPDALPYGNLTWICKYPSDKEGINANITMDEWLAKAYDYFWDLDDEKKQTSFLLEGPCYPSLTYSHAVFHVCQFRSVESTVSGNAVEEFKDCIARFENITDPEEYVRRVNVDCQSDNVLEEETTSSIDPNAYYQYKTLAKALDMDYARIPGEDTEDDGSMEAALNDALSGAGAVMERYFGDFQEAWVLLVVCGALLPLLFSSIWMLVMRYFTWVLVWTTLITANILLFGLTIAAYVKSGVIGHDEINSIPGSDNFYSGNPSPPPPVYNTSGDSSSTSNTTVVEDESTIDDAAKVAMLVCAIIGTVLTILLFLLTVLSIRRLNITIAILKVGTRHAGARLPGAPQRSLARPTSQCPHGRSR